MTRKIRFENVLVLGTAESVYLVLDEREVRFVVESDAIG